MSVLDLLSGDLEPTATYSARRWSFVPAGDRDTVDAPLGTLTIVCDYAKRNKVDTDSYTVFAARVPPGSGRHARSFELANVETGEIYAVTVGGPDFCGCKAAQCKLDCKHVTALRDLVAEADPETLSGDIRPVRTSAPPVEREQFARSTIVVPF